MDYKGFFLLLSRIKGEFLQGAGDFIDEIRKQWLWDGILFMDF
ncbi:hypothetical protein WIW50_14045 [Flavobacteriaceae bacterium 3-367]